MNSSKKYARRPRLAGRQKPESVSVKCFTKCVDEEGTI